METKTQGIAMKFGMLVIGLKEYGASTDELAKRNACFETPQ